LIIVAVSAPIAFCIAALVIDEAKPRQRA